MTTSPSWAPARAPCVTTAPSTGRPSWAIGPLRRSPATARCRCSSAIGTAPAAATCASPTTASTTDRARARSSSGGWARSLPRTPTPARTAGSISRVFGMGIASEDVTGDGYPEYFITTMAGNRLRMLADGPAQPTFSDSAFARGVDVPQPFAGDIDLPSTAWHAEWDDVNNDGRSDLYVAKGNVELMPDHAADDPSNLLIGQPDGTWSRGRHRGRHRPLRQDPRRGADRSQQRWPARPRRGQPRRAGPHLAQRRCWHGHGAGADGPLAGGRAGTGRTQRRRHRRLDRGRRRRPASRRARSPSAAAMSPVSSGLRTSGSAASIAPACA